MRWRALWLGMLIFSSTGCLNDRPARSTSFIDRVRGIGGPSGPDAVFIESILVERPAGGSTINKKVWENINEQVLPSEKRALLMENGLHIGIASGSLSSELEAMIANPKSSAGGSQQRLYVNKPAVLSVNGPVAQADYQVRTSMDAEPATAHFDQARFSIRIVPMHAPDGRLILKCVPEVEYHDKKSWLPTGAAGPGWMSSKPIEPYEALGWEVTLSSKEFLILGAYHERGAWLGNQIFGGTKGQDKVQRLLIIRAGRLSPAETGSEAASIGSASDGIAPIASQASVSAARGQRP